jgi:hypothetical protein
VAGSRLPVSILVTSLHPCKKLGALPPQPLARPRHTPRRVVALVLLLVGALVGEVGVGLGERRPEPLPAPAGARQGLAHHHPTRPSRPISGFEILCGPVRACPHPPGLPGCLLEGGRRPQRQRPGAWGDQRVARRRTGPLATRPKLASLRPIPASPAGLRDFSGKCWGLAGRVSSIDTQEGCETGQWWNQCSTPL